jgi:hypothetical protein
MNLIRMVKMFAWESKIKTQIKEKREEELHWHKRQQYLRLANIQAKCVVSLVLSPVKLTIPHTLFAFLLLKSTLTIIWLSTQLCTPNGRNGRHICIAHVVDETLSRWYGFPRFLVQY